MAHFLDRLVTYKFGNGLLFGDFLPELAQAECILADNVYRYFFEQSGYYQDLGTVGDQDLAQIDLHNLMNTLPSIVPPFAATFVASADYGAKLFKHGGVLLLRRPILDTQHQSFSMVLAQQNVWQSRYALHRRGVRWMIYAVPFVNIGHLILPPMFAVLLPVMEDGRLWRENAQKTFTWGRVLDKPGIARHARDAEGYKVLYDSHVDLFGYWVLPALFALSLIHCRNIEIIEHDPVKSRALRRQSERRQEKTGHGLIRFRTLQIEAVKRVLHEEGRIHEVGLAQALHLCRGHFKDYREGPGLFGKHHEVYWWNEHERGDMSEGVILKDYKTPPPHAVPIPD